MCKTDDSLREKFEEIACTECKVDKFSDIASAAKDENGNAILCPDQYVADYFTLSNGCHFLPKCPFEEKNSQSFGFTVKYGKSLSFFCGKSKINKEYIPEKTIVIILESPHKVEYNNNIEVAPLVGNRKIFYDIFSGIVLNSKKLQGKISGEYKIVLVNAIPFQCSLGASLSNANNLSIKENIFMGCIKSKSFKGYLIERIKKLKPDFIINLCTGIKMGCAKGLQLEVEQIITQMKYKYGVNYTRGSHPSSWSRGKAYIN